MGLIQKEKVIYANNWVEDKSMREGFAPEDLEMIDSIEVIAGNWNLSAKVNLKGGGMFFRELDRATAERVSVGDELIPSRCFYAYFHRGGDYAKPKIHYVFPEDSE